MVTGGKADLLRQIIARVDVFDDPVQVLPRLIGRTDPDRPLVLSFLNAHAVNLALADPGFHRALMESDLLIRDGIGLKLGMRLLRHRAGVNCNGTDLIPRLLEQLPGRRVNLCGTSLAVAGRAAAALRQRGITVGAVLDGFQPPETYVDLVRSRPGEVFLLGMGMPRQELLACRIRRSLGRTPVLIINGGAILDFLGGRFPRAPLPLRRLGLEWAFRLAMEPRRLWRRYLLGNAVFLGRVVAGSLPRPLPDAHPSDGHSGPHRSSNG